MNRKTWISLLRVLPYPHQCKASGSQLHSPIADHFSMDEADTWLFKEQDKWAETAFPIPNSPGNA